jgi:hypothetical protein
MAWRKDEISQRKTRMRKEAMLEASGTAETHFAAEISSFSAAKLLVIIFETGSNYMPIFMRGILFSIQES